jgi:nucleotide-binding universal stress UspA family protein
MNRPPDTQPHVVAGIDGSATALAAASCAAAEAQRRNAPLVLVHAFTWPWIYPPLTSEHPAADPLPRAAAQALLAAAADRVHEEYPNLAMGTRLVDGRAPAVLEATSRDAALLVVGHRGTGGFRERLAGSVAVHAATHAHCPVLVVRGLPAKPDAPVVLAIDPDDSAGPAVAFAFEEAAWRGASVRVVAVWPPDRAWPDALAGAGYPSPTATEQVLALLGDRPGRYPDVRVHTEAIRHRTPAGALVAAADGAGLIVVGAHGADERPHLPRLGSVSRVLIDHAPCPVAVVRPAG